MNKKHWVIITLLVILLGGAFSLRKNGVKLGLDLKGGSVLTYRIDTTGKDGSEKADILEQTREVFRKRLDARGLGEITIEKVGASSIRISLPGREQSEVAAIRDLLKKMGKLEFRILAVDGDPTETGTINLADEKRYLEEDPGGYAAPRGAEDDYPGYQWFPFKRPVVRDGKHAKDEQGKLLYTFEQTLVRIDRWNFTGAHLTDLTVSTNPRPPHNNWVVNFGIVDLKENDFANFTGPNSEDELGPGNGRQMAIILDGNIESAPVLQTELSDGGFIQGDFSKAEAENLVNVLRSGSLEVKPELESEYSVGPSLGEDAIKKGLTAITIGLILVIVVLLYYYLLQGLIANFALLLNLAILVGVLSFLGAALTLPGLAGIVLTVGMAVDANILIYERIREEKGKGKTLGQAVKNGYDRAFLTIVDANLTTVLTAIILYYAGTGPVRGFAITLIIGILASMLTALLVSRMILEWLMDKGYVTDIKFTPLLFSTRNAKYMKLRPVMIGLSIIIVIGGFLLFVSRGQEQQDIDFTGGAEVRMRFNSPQSIDLVRKTVAEKYPDATVVTVKSERASIEHLDLSRTSDFFMIKAKVADDEEQKKAFIDYLTTAFADQLMPSGVSVHDLDDTLDKEYARSHVGGKRLMIHFMEETEQSLVQDLLAEAGERVEGAAILPDGSWNPADGDGVVRTYRIYLKPEARLRTNAEIIDNVNRAAEARSVRLTEPIPGTTFIGALEAKAISEQALTAVLLSLIAQIIYIAFRFKGFSFGFAAVIALVHDVCISLGVVALMDLTGLVDVKINLPIIAAFLTLIGYSMNDTIVVFDRIRENKTKWKGTFSDLIDRSVNQNLSRTIRTSLTTFVVLAVIFVINRGAASVLEGFSFVMLAGVIVGTYSSIFIASPMLMFLPWFWKKADGVAPGFGGKVVMFAILIGVAVLLGYFEVVNYGLAFAAVICIPVIVGIVRWLFISDVDRALNIALRDDKNGGKA